MDKIEIELNLNSITDRMINLAEGIKEHRSAKLIDIEGKGISLTFACNKADHPFKDMNKSEFVDTGIFLMTITGPTTRQTAIEEFDEDNKDDIEAELEAKLKDSDEAVLANIFEYENEPKKAYYKRDGETLKTKAFEEYLESQI